MVAAVAGFFTGTWFTHEIIGGIVAGTLAAGLVALYEVVHYYVKYRKPFQIVYEPRREETYRRIDLHHQDEVTLIPMTMWFTARAHVERIRLTFTGGSNAPQIVGLYDWNTGEGLGNKLLDPNVHVKQNERGTWYWGYHNQLLRTPGDAQTRNTIRFGLRIQTSGTFDGTLDVQLTFEERRTMAKPTSLPVHVTIQR